MVRACRSLAAVLALPPWLARSPARARASGRPWPASPAGPTSRGAARRHPDRAVCRGRRHRAGGGRTARARSSTPPTTRTSGSAGARARSTSTRRRRSRNTSGSAIDRVELNTIAARLGAIRLDPVTVDGTPSRRRISDQTIVVPLGGVLPAGGDDRGPGPLQRHAAHQPQRLELAVHAGERRRRPLSLAAVGQPADRRSTGPNHGDPFVTPSSPVGQGARSSPTRKLVLATTGDRISVSADGLTQTFAATDVRDFTVTAATDYRTALARRRRHGRPRLLPPGRAGRGDARCRRRRLRRARAPAGRLSASSRSRWSSRPAAYGMESPGLIWIPTGAARANLRYLVAHETAHQWFYGIVGNDQSAAAVRRRGGGRFRRPLDPRAPSRAAAAPTATLDRSIYEYSAACYYEKVYIQGGNLLDDARRRMGSTAVLGGAARATWRPTGTDRHDRDVAPRAGRGDVDRSGRRCSGPASRGSTDRRSRTGRDRLRGRPPGGPPPAPSASAGSRPAAAVARRASRRRARPTPPAPTGPHDSP